MISWKLTRILVVSVLKMIFWLQKQDVVFWVNQFPKQYPRLKQSWPDNMIDFIQYQNQPIRFKREGLGHTLVLLHGFLESLDIWESFSEQLSRHFKVITLDLPGHGLSGSFGEVHN